jgi:hypothetical protein
MKPPHKRIFKIEGDAISGDTIIVTCQRPGKWKLFQKSSQHKGSICKLEKDAFAVITRAYTNIQK